MHEAGAGHTAAVLHCSSTQQAHQQACTASRNKWTPTCFSQRPYSEADSQGADVAVARLTHQAGICHIHLHAQLRFWQFMNAFKSTLAVMISSHSRAWMQNCDKLREDLMCGMVGKRNNQVTGLLLTSAKVRMASHSTTLHRHTVC